MSCVRGRARLIARRRSRSSAQGGLLERRLLRCGAVLLCRPRLAAQRRRCQREIQESGWFPMGPSDRTPDQDATAAESFFEHPILNSPYEPPTLPSLSFYGREG